ncbi:MAG: SDR family NAD(P)-dependent oxidoreductase, partial [Pseudomonadota bacterium]
MFDLTGKTAIVTGSTKGIGKAIAEAFAGAGAKVVISSRKADMCDEVAAKIRTDGHEAIAIPCHVGRREELEALVAKTVEAWGGVDILVCNAATNPVYGPMADAGDDAFSKIMETNVLSVYQLC